MNGLYTISNPNSDASNEFNSDYNSFSDVEYFEVSSRWFDPTSIYPGLFAAYLHQILWSLLDDDGPSANGQRPGCPVPGQDNGHCGLRDRPSDRHRRPARCLRANHACIQPPLWGALIPPRHLRRLIFQARSPRWGRWRGRRRWQRWPAGWTTTALLLSFTHSGRPGVCNGHNVLQHILRTYSFFWLPF